MSTRFSIHKFLIACALLGSVSFATAQNPSAGQGSAAGVFKTQVSFLLVANAQPLPSTAFIESGPKRTHIPVNANAVAKSDLVAYEGSRNLVLFFPSPPGVADTGTALARVELPKVTQSLVLLAPGASNPKGPSQYAAVAVADDWESFPAGTVRILNFSDKRTQAKVAGQSVTIDKGLNRPIKVIDPGKAEVDFPIEIATSETDGPFVAYKNSIKIRPNQRVTIIALSRPGESGRGISVVVTREVSAVRPAPGVKATAPGGSPLPR